MTDFCHITPTKYLDLFAGNRTHHLVLAHLVEEDPTYAAWYAELASEHETTVIMDNSAFEMFKQGRPMYPSEKLMEMGDKVKADYIVMSDYPGEPARKTIESAMKLGPEFHDAGFGTFFVPQAEVGNVEAVIDSFEWAAQAEEVDYIGVSILTAPNMFGVEKGNNLQRFLSRWKLMQLLEQRGVLARIKRAQKKVHFLGMVDGPNEIALVSDWLHYIDTWDSSAAVWAGLCDIEFDQSPTGLINGKNEIEVDFQHNDATVDQLLSAVRNINYIERQLEEYYD